MFDEILQEMYVDNCTNPTEFEGWVKGNSFLKFFCVHNDTSRLGSQAIASCRDVLCRTAGVCHT